MNPISKILFPKKTNRRSGESSIFFITLILIILGSLAFVGGLSPAIRNSSSNNKAVIIKDIPLSSPGYTLQLKNLSAVTPTPIPTPGSSCNHDNGKPAQENNGQCVPDAACTCGQWLVECRNHKCFRVISKGNSPISDPSSCDTSPGRAILDGWCSIPSLTGSGDCVYCLGKPVIYLYPTQDTIVNVKINTPGSIVESIPFYPNEGWKNILAHPNGNLEYLGKTYKELYYESSVPKVNPPKEGFVVRKNKTEEKLRELTSRLGLIKSEQEEFLNYWLPKVNNLNSPYLFISVISKEEKDRIDNVEILPKPDTKIEFIVYFKPVYKPFSALELKLPLETVKRIGFTSVEWGGTIENN